MKHRFHLERSQTKHMSICLLVKVFEYLVVFEVLPSPCFFHKKYQVPFYVLCLQTAPNMLFVLHYLSLRRLTDLSYSKLEPLTCQ